jgi:hypothetical protein
MSRTLILKRGTSQQNDAYIGSSGEVTIDLTNKSLRLHDGVTIGGHQFVSLTLLNSSIAAAFMDHSVSNDHDDLYYRKEIIDNLLETTSSKNESIDVQNANLLVDNSTLGWKLQKGEIEINRSGYWHHPDSPSWTSLKNGIYCHTFESWRRKEFWSTFIVDHDYAEGTKIYPFIDWSKANGSSGDVKWGFEYVVAKSYNQGNESNLNTSSLVYVTTTVPNSNNRRNFTTELSEQQAIPSTNLEPGSIIKIRCFRDGYNDSYNDDIYLTGFGIKYQMKRLATKNKSPNFFQ